jgi:hypothetical protein
VRRPSALLVAVLAVVLAQSPRASAGSAPLRVIASLDGASVLYGDPVTAVVEVEYDPESVDPASIKVEPSFIPYVPTSSPVVHRPGTGTLQFTYSLLCVSDDCLPTRGARVVRLQPVAVTGSAGGRMVHATGSWPVLRVSTRLSASDLSGPVRFRSPSAPPPPSYRVAPGLLAGALLAAAAFALLAALVLAGRELLPLRRRGSAARRLSSLDLAVAYVRDSAGRSGSDRRRALSLLAEAAVDSEPALAAAADDTAWSEPQPTPARATELADLAARGESSGT